MQTVSAGEFCFLYSTFPDSVSAETAARALVSAKLAACVNVYPPMKSFYVWQGRLEDGPEVAAFFKLRASDIDAAIKALRPLHPYTVPCFLVLPFVAGNPDYLAWAREQTERTATI